MYTRIFASALMAGVAAGVIAAVLQLTFVQPVLLHAELYETGALVHAGASPARPDVGGFDLLRDGLSVLFTTLTYTAYALITVAAMSVAEGRGAVVNGRTGLIWGLAGFVVVHLAPGFGLPPETPGVGAASVEARQVWWFVTVGLAAAALWLIAFGRSWRAWGAAAILLLLPHVVGAPDPTLLVGPAPTEIGALFAARALGVGLAAWVLVGCFAGYFWRREAERARAVQAV